MKIVTPQQTFRAKACRMSWAWGAITALIIIVLLLLTDCQVPLRN